MAESSWELNEINFFDATNQYDISPELSSESTLLPIVVLGGMAQSTPSWERHLPTLSKERDIFIYEYLGSGLGYRHPEINIDKNEVNEVCLSVKTTTRVVFL